MRIDTQKVKSILKSFVAGYAMRMHLATSTLLRQIGLYVFLLVFFSIAIQPATLTCHYLVEPWGWICRKIFWVEVLVPSLANVIVILVAVRARTFFFYLLITFVLTYMWAIAYFLSLLDAIYRKPMDGPGFVMFWVLAWFGGIVVGLIVKFLMWKYRIKWQELKD